MLVGPSVLVRLSVMETAISDALQRSLLTDRVGRLGASRLGLVVAGLDVVLGR